MISVWNALLSVTRFKLGSMQIGPINSTSISEFSMICECVFEVCVSLRPMIFQYLFLNSYTSCAHFSNRVSSLHYRYKPVCRLQFHALCCITSHKSEWSVMVCNIFHPPVFDIHFMWSVSFGSVPSTGYLVVLQVHITPLGCFTLHFLSDISSSLSNWLSWDLNKLHTL